MTEQEPIGYLCIFIWFNFFKRQIIFEFEAYGSISSLASQLATVKIPPSFLFLEMIVPLVSGQTRNLFDQTQK